MAMGELGSGFEMRVANQRTGNARLTIGDSRSSDGGWVGMHGARIGGGVKWMGIPTWSLRGVIVFSYYLGGRSEGIRTGERAVERRGFGGGDAGLYKPVIQPLSLITVDASTATHQSSIVNSHRQ
jgi:hypothetical protein